MTTVHVGSVDTCWMQWFVLITFVYFLDDKREEHQNCEYWPDQC